MILIWIGFHIDVLQGEMKIAGALDRFPDSIAASLPRRGASTSATIQHITLIS
jgi:hypothetical protein